MPDDIRHPRRPDGDDGIDIDRAFARLPQAAPARSAWPLIAARLRRRRRVWPAWALAAAATVAVAVLLPALRVESPGVAGPAADAELAQLMARSARLEAGLADERSLPFSAPIVALSLDIEDRLRLIDAELGLAPRDPAATTALWRERVALLDELAQLQRGGIELAEQGRTLDAALVVAY